VGRQDVEGADPGLAEDHQRRHRRVGEDLVEPGPAGPGGEEQQRGVLALRDVRQALGDRAVGPPAQLGVDPARRQRSRGRHELSDGPQHRFGLGRAPLARHRRGPADRDPRRDDDAAVGPRQPGGEVGGRRLDPGVADGEDDGAAELLDRCRGGRDPAPSQLGCGGGHQQRDDDEHEHGVDDCLAEQPQLEPHDGGRQGCRRLRAGEREHRPGLGPREPEQGPGEGRSDRLAAEAGGDQSGSDAEGLGVRHHSRVDDQADADEEQRDEQRRAEELRALHQRRAVRDELVELETGEEGTDQTFDGEDLGDHGGREQGGEQEDEPQRALLTDAAEERLAHPGEHDEAPDDQRRQPERHLQR